MAIDERAALQQLDDITRLREQMNELTAQLAEQQALVGDYAAVISQLMVTREELLVAGDVPSLLRAAVEQIHVRLGLERLSVWLCTESPNEVVGTFGIDEHGNLRDEQASRVTVHPRSMMGRVLAQESRLLVQEDDTLFNEYAEVIGTGSHAIAALWDGQRVLGCLSADTYLSGAAFTPLQRNTIGIIAAVIGHRISELRLRGAQLDLTHLLRLLLDNTPHPVYIRSAAGDVIMGNRALAELYGLTVDAMIGLSQQELFARLGMPPEYAASALAEDRSVMESGLPSVRVKAFPDAAGHTRWFRSLRCKVTLRDGTACILALSEDITETKLVSDALKASEARYRRIVETAQEGICTVDAIGYITYVNPQMAAMLGYTPDQVLGRSALDFVDARTGIEMMEFVMRRQDGFDGNRDIRVRRKDGRDLWVNISLTPIVEQENLRGVLVMATDVTKRKEAEYQLERQRAFYIAGAEIVPVPMFILSPEREVIWTNRALEAFAARHALSLREPPELRDADTRELVPPERWPGSRAMRGEMVPPTPYLLGAEAVRVLASASPVVFDGAVIAAAVVLDDRV